MFKVQAHATRTISWWHKNKTNIDFHPPYQRKGNLWGDRDKAYLIDSIINEYDIPKIYMADFTILNSDLNAQKLPYAIIDGRQRMESIFMFYRDEIKLNEDFVLLNDPNIKIGGYTYSKLKSEFPTIADNFDEFNLDVMSVITDDVEKIRDLFVRLNRSKALTGAELRNAMEGIVPTLIKGLADRKFFKDCVKFPTSRGQDGNVAAKLLLLEFREKFVDTKKSHLDKFVKEGAKTDNPEAYYDAAYRAEAMLDRLYNIFETRDPLLSTHGLLPIYYTLVKQVNNDEDIREFLADFDRRRKENQALSKSNPHDANNQLLTFDSLVRSINDTGSLQSAYTILWQEYQAYKPKG